ncbi:hypothetical protein MAR_014229 [Mya arenaria]|uniref:Myb/SANT-like DNA-binding domain-containing protein n=1 Tax=Mya arenaria TaxID=6604 RepID=A0ABY7G240_MYAAR|nr:hypothetical protein MAR_014229 [Mya arenaria]
MAMKRDRQTNWSMAEESNLVDFCVNKYSFLYGGLGPDVTKQGRHTKWEELLEELSASAAKKKEMKRRHFAAGTGGGLRPKSQLI